MTPLEQKKSLDALKFRKEKQFVTHSPHPRQHSLGLRKPFLVLDFSCRPRGEWMSEYLVSQLAGHCPRGSSPLTPSRAPNRELHTGGRYWKGGRWDSQKALKGHGSCSLHVDSMKKSAHEPLRKPHPQIPPTGHGHLHHPACFTHTYPHSVAGFLCVLPKAVVRAGFGRPLPASQRDTTNLGCSTTFGKQR